METLSLGMEKDPYNIGHLTINSKNIWKSKTDTTVNTKLVYKV